MSWCAKRIGLLLVVVLLEVWAARSVFAGSYEWRRFNDAAWQVTTTSPACEALIPGEIALQRAYDVQFNRPFHLWGSDCVGTGRTVGNVVTLVVRSWHLRTGDMGASQAIPYYLVSVREDVVEDRIDAWPVSKFLPVLAGLLAWGVGFLIGRGL